MDLQKRWSEWQAASPFKLTVVGMVTSNDRRMALGRAIADHLSATGASHYAWACVQPEVWRTHLFAEGLRRYFKERRVHGDWFDLDDATLNSLPMERP